MRIEKEIEDLGAKKYNIIVVIPACNEYDYIQKCINSLRECDTEGLSVLIIIIVNNGYLNNEETILSNERTIEFLNELNKINDNINFLFEYYREGINGVGMARKVGMDLAYDIFNSSGKDGIIACLDADCVVDTNYFLALDDGFANNSKKEAASVRFEHNLVDESIIKYELHLRYYIDIQRRVNLPFAYQTVGSAMAVRSTAYRKQGGMNKRQAGEDFYFLQKFISLDKCFEINTTKVIPSGRKSQRVPFGTGKAIVDIESNNGQYMSYHPRSFYKIEKAINYILHSWNEVCEIPKADEKVISYFESQNYIDKWAEILNNTSSKENFKKRFFKWFNAFRLMKCLHHLDDRMEIHEACRLYLSEAYEKNFITNSDMLQFLKDQAYGSNVMQDVFQENQ